MLTEKVYIGLDNAPTAFDIRSRILGQGGTNLEYIRSETGVVAILKGGLSDKFEPLHLSLHHARQESLAAARSLAHNLIETVRAELAQWSAAHASVPPPTLNVPPPTTPSNALGQPPPNVANPTPTVNTSISVTSAMSSIPQQATFTSIVSVPSSSTPLMTVRQPTVLQLFPQQQYVLNQENGQLIPIVQSPIQMAGPGSGITNLTALPISQSLNSMQQPLGTQILDISSMQPVNVTPLRINSIPGTVPMFVQNGLTFHQVSSGNVPEVTSVTSTVVPIVSASTAQGSNKIAWNLDKDKQLSGDTIQWTVPGSQTMLIPYQNIQEFTSQAGLPNLQAAQQIISMGGAGMAWTGGAAQMHTSLGSTAMHAIHPHNPNILHINPKLSANNTSFINIISSGSQNGVTIPSQGQMIATGASTTSKQPQESRGQKRQSDGSPSQMQLRPIAPAGSQLERGSSLREVRAHAVYTHNQGREVNFSGSPQMMTVKVNTSLGGVQTISSSGPSGNQDPSKGDKILVPSTKDINKVNEPKIISGSNVQMILPQGMTVLPNQIGQIPSSLGQGQIYMIPASQANLHSGNIQQNLVPQQVIPQGNITMMQYPQSHMQYNTVPLMQVVPPGAQFISNPQVSHHLLPNQASTSQANSTTLPSISTAQIIPISQGQTLQYIQNLQPNEISQNSPYVLGNQFSNTHQYVMQSNGNMPAQYNVQPQTVQENDSSQTIQSENGQTASSGNGQGFIESVNAQGYPAPPAQPVVSTPQQVTALPYQPNQLPPAPNIPPPSGNYPAPNIQPQNGQVYPTSNTGSPQPSQINFGQSQSYQGQGQGQGFGNGQSYQPVGDGQGNGYVGAGPSVQYGAPGPAPVPVPGGPAGPGGSGGPGGPAGSAGQYGGGGSRPWFRAPPPGYTAPPPPVPQAPLAPPQGTYTYWQEPQPNV